MPIEEYGEEGLKKIPNLDLAQALFTLQTNQTSDQDKNDAKSLLEKEITENSKIFSYSAVFNDLLFYLFFLNIYSRLLFLVVSLQKKTDYRKQSEYF